MICSTGVSRLTELPNRRGRDARPRDDRRIVANEMAARDLADFIVRTAN